MYINLKHINNGNFNNSYSKFHYNYYIYISSKLTKLQLIIFFSAIHKFLRKIAFQHFQRKKYFNHFKKKVSYII